MVSDVLKVVNWEGFCDLLTDVDVKIRVENVFVTNGTILTQRCLNMLQNVNVDYIQITLDGIKDTHDKRRIKLNGEGTFERIVGNITTLVKRSFQVVIRINVDKRNEDSCIKLIEFLANKFDKRLWESGLIAIDIARVFGSPYSLSMSEFFEVKERMLSSAYDSGMFRAEIPAGTFACFCDAEKSSKDNLVIDEKGYVYKCWNYIFDENSAYGCLDTKGDLKITNPKGIDRYISELSLSNIMNDCFKCKWFPLCRGMCPDFRSRMFKGTEEPIYETGTCKNLVRNHVEFLLKLKLKEAKYAESY